MTRQKEESKEMKSSPGLGCRLGRTSREGSLSVAIRHVPSRLPASLTPPPGGPPPPPAAAAALAAASFDASYFHMVSFIAREYLLGLLSLSCCLCREYMYRSARSDDVEGGAVRVCMAGSGGKQSEFSPGEGTYTHVIAFG